MHERDKTYKHVVLVRNSLSIAAAKNKAGEILFQFRIANK